MTMKIANAKKKFLQALAMVSLGVAASSAMAASSWDFGACSNNGANQQATNSGTFGNSWKCSGVTVYGFGAGTTASGTAGSLQTAYVSPQGTGSGFGLASKYEGIGATSPNHAIDNAPSSNAPDMILLKFDTAVALGSVTVGWSQSDADLTVMAYTGAQNLTSYMVGKTASTGSGGLLNGGVGAGWALVENVGDNDGSNAGYSGDGTDITRNVNASNVVSSWWLISAYNSGFGAGGLDTLSDYVKLLAVASKDVQSGGSAPEPGTLAMAGVALLALAHTRRRAKKTS
jgi:MYXO-CTERM domain-containing protein